MSPFVAKRAWKGIDSRFIPKTWGLQFFSSIISSGSAGVSVSSADPPKGAACQIIRNWLHGIVRRRFFLFLQERAVLADASVLYEIQQIRMKA